MDGIHDDNNMDSIVPANDNNDIIDADKQYLATKNDKNWTSIVNLLDESVRIDNKVEKDLQKLLQKANRSKESSNLKLKDAILSTYPDINQNYRTRSKSLISKTTKTNHYHDTLLSQQN